MQLRVAAFFLILGSAVSQTTWQQWLDEGVRAFKSAHYSEAVTAFQKAVDLNPSAVPPRLYLATAWMSQYIPGATSPENAEAANNAERGFFAVLDLDPRNVTAIQSLASLKYLQAQAVQDPAAKLRMLAGARDWYVRLIEVAPRNREAHDSIGVIDWAIWYPDYMAARTKLGLRPEQPGPLPDAAARADLRSRHEQMLLDGIDHLNKALSIDPEYDDAMAYQNLLLREYADLSDSPADYEKMTAEADTLVQKALATRQEKRQQDGLPGAISSGGGGGGGDHRVSQPAPPPPPPDAHAVAPPATPSRIAVGSAPMNSKLISQPKPVYPPEAKKAGIQGVVHMKAVIGKDGSILKLELMRGDPALVDAAMTAVRQWKYEPVRLNGEPVEVITTIDVNFTLNQ